MIKTIKCAILLVLFSLPLIPSAAFSQVNINADDPNIQYIGRVKDVGTTAPNYDWPGVYINAVFQGTSITARFTIATTSYFEVFIDSQPTGVLLTFNGQANYPLATGLADTSHTVSIYKRNGVGGNRITFNGFTLDNGKTLLPPAPRPSRRIEVIGDSLSVGYGSEMV